ncbi:hypothetical protein ZEAMMB73_Zm00001d010939 [Zea mays]|uniref:Uncharacterized protein n=1 Tax=Zea mays TaxID=4577 RepID=A0A1D6FV07_MAIZE|nr:hypothetical protein ZEAMMB73_Zm00001d010939 [Zea mays]
MARRRRLSASSLPEAAGAIPSALPPELRWPFARLEALTQDELRESVYEIFFCACRSAPGGGTRPSAAARGSRGGAATPTRPPPEVSSPTSGGAKNMAVTSRLKRALGLRARNTRPTVGAGGRPLTSAEIMRRQMGVSEQTDARLRKTLVRSLVGPQMSRKVDSLVLPLELLRHLKPADFFDAGEHRAWQLRQLRVLEAGLVSHPSVPLDRGNASASALRDTVRSAELQTRPVLDARALSAVVAALCRRSVDACRWADGYPLNVHLYLTLLRAVFAAPARPTLRLMKQNLAFLSSVLTEQAQLPAVLEVMRASVEAFLTVVLAGGSGRAFARGDHAAVAADFASLKRLFCSFGVGEEAVERETVRAEGVLALMAVPTEQLIHELLGHYASTPMRAAGDELPQLPMMPMTPTARRWSRSDANTVLRVLCYRDDEPANRFLKKTFNLPKRR